MVTGDDVVMDATVVPEDVARVDTPTMRGYALAALHAVTDPRCSHLAMTSGRLVKPWLFRLRFSD